MHDYKYIPVQSIILSSGSVLFYNCFSLVLMAHLSPLNEDHERSIEEGVFVNPKVDESLDKAEKFRSNKNPSKTDQGSAAICVSVPFLQKLIAEALGTYFLIFAGCASAIVNLSRNNVVTLPGMAVVWGLAVLVMVYSVGHISGAHFNPAVTIAFATCNRFSWKQVPGYVSAQMVGAILASGTLRTLFGWEKPLFVGTAPSGSDIQSLVLEFIITFYLMFVISGVATDDRAVGQFAGLAVGATILINVMLAGPISGASMNPARSLGPAIAACRYKGIWIYIAGPISGAIAGACAYNSIRSTKTPSHETTRKHTKKETSTDNPLFSN